MIYDDLIYKLQMTYMNHLWVLRFYDTLALADVWRMYNTEGVVFITLLGS